MNLSGFISDKDIFELVSYNDITVDSGLRDFVGWAWYGRTFSVDNLT